MTLNTELAAFRACMLDRVGSDAPHVRAAETLLAESDFGQRAPQVGDVAPDFTLPDQRGVPVRLSDVLREGPVILTFYRGAWCPFCMIALRGLQRIAARAAAIPARILAVAPQDVATAQQAAQTHGLTYSLLSDTGAEVGKAWSLMFQLPEPLRPLYERLGHALPRMNACGTWAVPVTATYVIGQDGRIVHAHIDPRVHVRMEPEEALAAARTAAAQGKNAAPSAAEAQMLQAAD